MLWFLLGQFLIGFGEKQHECSILFKYLQKFPWNDPCDDTAVDQTSFSFTVVHPDARTCLCQLNVIALTFSPNHSITVVCAVSSNLYMGFCM